jgi:RNA polymerase sigma-70 factor (ECF subfamily)
LIVGIFLARLGLTDMGAATLLSSMPSRSQPPHAAATTNARRGERQHDDAKAEAEMLLRAAQRGDRSAQSRLFSRHRERVARHVLRMIGDPSAVDDLVQEVFISAFAALPRFRGSSRIETWLYTITANTVRTWWDTTRRRRRREQHVTLQPETSADTPEEQLARRRHRARFYEALGRLPHRYREAFVARAIEGMSLKHASELLGVGVSTLSYRTRRAEDLLCDALGVPRRDS